MDPIPARGPPLRRRCRIRSASSCRWRCRGGVVPRSARRPPGARGAGPAGGRPPTPTRTPACSRSWRPPRRRPPRPPGRSTPRAARPPAPEIVSRRSCRHASSDDIWPRPGVASRRRAEELITKGEVRVNGETVAQLGYQVDTENATGSRCRAAGSGPRLPSTACCSSREPACPRWAETTRGEKRRPNLARYVPDRDIGWQVVAPARFSGRGRAAADDRRGAGPGDGPRRGARCR